VVRRVVPFEEVTLSNAVKPVFLSDKSAHKPNILHDKPVLLSDTPSFAAPPDMKAESSTLKMKPDESSLEIRKVTWLVGWI
jgi:hypothetical protein